MPTRDAGLHLRLIHAATGVLLAAVGIGGAYMAGGNVGIGLIAFYLVAGLAVAILPGLLFTRTLTAPLRALEEAMGATRNDGDLSRIVPVSSAGNVARAASAYNELIASFRNIASRILFTSEQVAAAADQLMVNAKATDDGSQRQDEAAERAANAVAEMGEGVRDVAQRAAEAAAIAQAASEKSARGSAIVGEASAEILRIAQSVDQSAKVVSALGERSSDIARIVQVIREIADQTNLLALNAAIEAARAGEQGRGFAVVADEVRKLAERTTAATAEIAAMIAAIQAETTSAIESIRAGEAQAANGAQLARQAADALNEINQGAHETMEKVSFIAGAMSEQKQRTQDIAEQVTNIMGIAESNSDNARRTLEQATELDYLSTNLKEIGTVFKLGDSGRRANETHQRMTKIVREAAQAAARTLESAIDGGQLSLEALFDGAYAPIANTEPRKFKTKYDDYTDRALPPVQEPILDRHSEIAYAIACDAGGYVPTHNRRYCQPLTGDRAKDFVGNRTKRIFDDPVGKRCGSHDLPFLLQTYRRDTGELMHDISAPITVKGRHWGGFRIGYRTE